MSTRPMDFVKAKIHEIVTPGEALRMIRELQELSQNDLARLANMNQSNYQHIEKLFLVMAFQLDPSTQLELSASRLN
jgi:transcriptional regulator with XRE-family HTH domain